MKHFKTVLWLVIFVPFVVWPQYAENDWEERDTWMNVSDIFDQASIKKGSRVADIGCHEGYLTIHLAQTVGKEGYVYAVDVEEDRLQTLHENLKKRALFHVDVIHGDYDDPKLPKNTLDAVIIMDSYHEMTAYMTILKHAKASLKPGGRIVIIEKLKSRIEGKSRKEQTRAHSLGMHYVQEELQKAGFKLTYSNDHIGLWENDPDKIIWMLVAENTIKE